MAELVSEIKEQNSLQQELKRLLRTHLLAIAGFSILANLLQLTIPLYMMQMFDRVLPAKSAETLFYLTVIAVTALLFWGTLQVVRQRVFVTLGNWLQEQLGLPVYKKAISSVLEGNSYASRALQDLKEVSTFAISPAAAVIFDLP
jgi:ABC-type protease/lipase transport system fused ATPase/permease subunit